MVKKLLLGALLLSVPTISAGPAHAAGLHLGWCIGVGNQHQTTNCDTGGGSSVATGGPGIVTPPLGSTTTLAPTLPLGPGKLSKPKPAGGYGAVPAQPVLSVPSVTLTGPRKTSKPKPGGGYGPVPTQPVLAVPSIPSVGPRKTSKPKPGGGGVVVPPLPVVAVPPVILVAPGKLSKPKPPGGYGAVPPQPVVVVPPIVFAAPHKISKPKPASGYGPVPPQPVVQVPPTVPSAGQTPGRIPTQVPIARPVPTPIKVPGKAPAQIVTTTPPGTGTTGGMVGIPVPIIPGRQPAHLRPVYADSSGSGAIECVSAGFGARRVEENSGAIRHAGQIDSFARDVPARHPETARCLIQLRHKQ